MINAIEDKIVVEYLRKTSTSTGLVIPEVAQDPQGYGKVLSLGEKIENKKIKVDDILVFHTRAGMDLIQGRKVLKCLKYEEVYGILDDDDLVSRLEPLDFTVKSEKSKIIQPAKRGGIQVVPS